MMVLLKERLSIIKNSKIVNKIFKRKGNVR